MLCKDVMTLLRNAVLDMYDAEQLRRIHMLSYYYGAAMKMVDVARHFCVISREEQIDLKQSITRIMSGCAGPAFKECVEMIDNIRREM